MSAKDSSGKRRWTLVPWSALGEVVDVLMFGAGKYSDHGWKTVVDGERVYLDAALRHLSAHMEGRMLDDESGLPHLAHAATDVLIALWHLRHGKRR